MEYSNDSLKAIRDWLESKGYTTEQYRTWQSITFKNQAFKANVSDSYFDYTIRLLFFKNPNTGRWIASDGTLARAIYNPLKKHIVKGKWFGPQTKTGLEGFKERFEKLEKVLTLENFTKALAIPKEAFYPEIIQHLSKPLRFADDKSGFITSKNETFKIGHRIQLRNNYISEATIIDIVHIDKNKVLRPVESPDHEPWFLIKLEITNPCQILPKYIISKDDCYYCIYRASNKTYYINLKQTPFLTIQDSQSIFTLINSYVYGKENVKNPPNKD